MKEVDKMMLDEQARFMHGRSCVYQDLVAQNNG